MNKIAGLVSLLTLTVSGEVRGCCESFRLESGGMGEFYQVRYFSEKVGLRRLEKYRKTSSPSSLRRLEKYLPSDK